MARKVTTIEADPLPPRVERYLGTVRIPVAVSTGERDMPLVFVNDRFCTLTGYAAQEVLGRTCRWLQGGELPHDSRQELQDFMTDCRRPAGHFPMTSYRRDGARVDTLVVMTRLRRRDREIDLVLASHMDLTQTVRRAMRLPGGPRPSAARHEVHTVTRQARAMMIKSAQAVSESVALLAQISLDESGP